MGAIFRWVRMLYLFFAAVTRRLEVFPEVGVPLTLTAGAAWVYGAIVQIDADIGGKAIRIYQIDMSNPSGADYEVSIGYGVVGAETWFGPVTMNLASVTLPFPLEVPANQRLIARCRDNVGGNTVDVKVLAYTIT